MADKEEQKQRERMRHLNGTENEDDLYSEEDSIANPAGSSETPAGAIATAEPEGERVRLSLRTANGKAMPFRVKVVSSVIGLHDREREREILCTDKAGIYRQLHCKSWRMPSEKEQRSAEMCSCHLRERRWIYAKRLRKPTWRTKTL